MQRARYDTTTYLTQEEEERKGWGRVKLVGDEVNEGEKRRRGD